MTDNLEPDELPRISWQDLPTHPGGIYFQGPLFELPSDESIRAFSHWMAEQIALSERIRKESASIVRCSTTHTMVVMHDGEVVYNKHPDKVVPPAIFG